MAERHKWADVIIAMANGEVAEYQRPEGGVWFRSDINDTNPFTDAGCEWRIKPRTIMIGDMEVPEPLRVAPKQGETVFRPCVVKEVGYKSYKYDHWNWNHIRYLEVGFLHSTKQAAIAHDKALIKILGGKV